MCDPLLAGEHKTGGGLRIKRLMVHDPGIESGEHEGELLTEPSVAASWDEVSGSGYHLESRPMSPNRYEGCVLYEPLEKETQTMKERSGGKDNETQTGPVGRAFTTGRGV